MQTSVRLVIGLASCLALPISLPAQNAGCEQMFTGRGASLNGFRPFDSDSLWNKDISSAAVAPNSANIIKYIGGSTPLHPDFGSGLYDGSTIGIPYVVVDSGQPLVSIDITGYPDESDPGPAAVPHNAWIEGYPRPGNGDRHVLVLEKGGCWLYEMFAAVRNADGTWQAGSTALWDLLGNEQRPYTWTSADAAGLPIFAGLARYDEIEEGAIHHALRYTLPRTREAFVLPATHWASTITDTNAPPMGMRLRLKAAVDISGFSRVNQVILTALKKYGMILADNGSGIFFGGAPDNRWNNDDLGNLHQLTATDFEVVDMGTIYTPANVPTGAAPSIDSFTASPATIMSGSSAQLSWMVSRSEYNIVDPSIGAARGDSVTVAPTQTTTYSLITTNRYGRTTRSVTVTVE